MSERACICFRCRPGRRCGRFLRRAAADCGRVAWRELDSLPERVSWGLAEWGVAQAPGGYERCTNSRSCNGAVFEDCRRPPGRRRRCVGYPIGVRIRIITHRLFIKYFHQIAVSQTIQWLDRHDIPYWDLCFMQEKTAVGADLYIEDSPSNVERLRAEGRRRSSLKSSTDEALGVTVRHTWAEVLEVVMAEKRAWESP